MALTEVISILASLASIILAACAVFYAWQSESKSKANYEGTRELLDEISQKSAVIESAVSKTQSKLVDTVIANATPRQTQEEMMMQAFLPMLQSNPDWLRGILEQSVKPSNDPTRPKPPRRR
ncbi:MAG: hypothetical protein OXH91_01840 [Chloroflexota bacterium]|nr:hypothetical protein [Chloroflexota bacterium]